VPGSADRSYGIHVAQLAGVPRWVTRRAAEVLSTLETQRDLRGGPGKRVTFEAEPVEAEEVEVDEVTDRHDEAEEPGAAAMVPIRTAKSNGGGSGNGHARRVRMETVTDIVPAGHMATQLALFVPAPPHPAVEALRGLDVLNMTPLEALNRLAELARLAQEP
jgi:DNA mismatch repair protein MutS